MKVTSKIETIIYFSQRCRALGFEFIVATDSSFPDALISFDGNIYYVEFEYMASSFIAHKHDERSCDIIICWKNDLGDFVLPILEIGDDQFFTQKPSFVVPSYAEKESSYLSRMISVLERENKALIRRVDTLLKMLDEKGEELPSNTLNEELKWEASYSAIINTLSSELIGSKQDRFLSE